MDHVLNSRGFDVILVKEELISLYQCPLCSLILKKPIQTERGERACSDCYYELHERNQDICPIDGEKINIRTSTFPDRFLQRQIAELDCYCNNKPNKCPWKGKLRDVESHVKDCLYIYYECRLCDEMVLLKDKDYHNLKKCPETVIHCKFCREEMKRRMLKIHNEKCLQRPIACPYQCGETKKREELREHLLLYCQSLKSGKSCPFSIVGCSYSCEESESTSSKLLEHLSEDMHVHTGYLLQAFQKVVHENDLLKDELLKLQGEIKNLSKPTPSLEREIEKAKTLSNQIDVFEKDFKLSQDGYQKYINELKNIVTEINESTKSKKLFVLEEEVQEVYKNYEEIENLISRSQKNDISDYGVDAEKELKNLSQRIEELESQNAISDSNIVELKKEMDHLQGMSYDGDIIWRIPNIMLKMSEARKGKNVTAIHSPPCYSKKGGYRFCARLYLNGDGIGKGTHVSLFIVIMKTDYDVLLEWPFQERVSFELIHPYNKSFNLKESFIPDHNSSSFQKPVKEMNIAAGCPLFIRKEDLQARNFIVDDCIYIRTTVGKII